jgi:hypothetical protein
VLVLLGHYDRPEHHARIRRKRLNGRRLNRGDGSAHLVDTQRLPSREVRLLESARVLVVLRLRLLVSRRFLRQPMGALERLERLLELRDKLAAKSTLPAGDVDVHRPIIFDRERKCWTV